MHFSRTYSRVIAFAVALSATCCLSLSPPKSNGAPKLDWLKSRQLANGSLPAWQKAKCSDPLINDPTADGTARWNAADAETAWTAAIANWTAEPHLGGLSFPEQISYFFSGPPQLVCGQTSDHNGCDSPLSCSQTAYPAGYFILNSFVAINNLNLNLYDAIGRVEANMALDIGTFTSDFAPQVDKSSGAKLLLDILGLSFSLFASPMWNSVFKTLPFFKSNGNTLGTLKDMVNPIVSNGITIAKDEGILGVKISIQNDLATNLGNMVGIYYDTVNTLNSNLFNGSQASIDQLHQMITDGKLLGPATTPDDLTIQKLIETSIYSRLIPAAWSLSNTDVHPVVISTTYDCSTVNPFSNTYLNPDDDTASATGVCYNNQRYFLLSASGDLNIGGRTDASNYFWKPPGIEKLDGNAFGGITRDQFVIGALNSFIANGYKEGWASVDETNAASVAALYDQGPTTPGVVQIQICGVEEAWANWGFGGNRSDPRYPCILEVGF